MKLKETIQKDFIEAMKAKDVNAKAALSSLKSKTTRNQGCMTLTISTIVGNVVSGRLNWKEEILKLNHY